MFQANEITNGITTGVDVRRQRGLEIAAVARIELKDGAYLVPSQSNPRQMKYRVSGAGEAVTCNCPDHQTRNCKWKHIYAVEYYVKREQNADGSTTITESVTITESRKTYAQDWPAYNAAQQNEKREFQTLLADLCKNLPALPATERKGPQGRPSMPLSDAVFAIVYKIYSTFSGRRFTSDLCDAQAKGYLSRVPHYNTAFKYIEKPEMFPILMELIERTSLPLRAVEENFAVDSTGFAFSRFVKWFELKYNRFTSEQQWIKAHVCTGAKTNIVTAVEIHGRDAGDATQFPALVKTTAKNFAMKEISADKGYTGNPAHDAAHAVGAEAYIMFKSNATGAVGGLYEKAWYFFRYNREKFLAHYHRRSNVESTFMMIKTKFGDAVRSKSEVAARNEVLCKILCHNICCLISAMYELGIKPELGLEAPAHKSPSLPTKDTYFGLL